MSAFLNFRAQQTSYIAILCTTKILLLPRFLKCTFPLPAFTETCFEVNALGEFAPDRSVCTVEALREGDAPAAPATSYSRDLIEYMTADACDRVMTSHDACTSGTSRVLTVASLKRLNMEALIPAPADCEVPSSIKFLKGQRLAPVEIHRQLCKVCGHTRLDVNTSHAGVRLGGV